MNLDKLLKELSDKEKDELYQRLIERKQKQSYMYVLGDPRNPSEIRYVGKARNFRQRYHKHINDCKDELHRLNMAQKLLKSDKDIPRMEHFAIHNNDLKSGWIRCLLSKKIEPFMMVIEGEVPEYKTKEFEYTYINRFLSLGHRLLNHQYVESKYNEMEVVDEELRNYLNEEQELINQFNERFSEMWEAIKNMELF